MCLNFTANETLIDVRGFTLCCEAFKARSHWSSVSTQTLQIKLRSQTISQWLTWSVKKSISKQECIAVGFVPAAHWPYAGGGLPGRGCLLPGGSPWQGVLPSGGSPCRGGSPWQGGSPWWVVSLAGGGIPACTEADLPPVNRMTDRCKNITLATTSLRPVIIGTIAVTTSQTRHWRPVKKKPSSALRLSGCETTSYSRSNPGHHLSDVRISVVSVLSLSNRQHWILN